MNDSNKDREFSRIEHMWKRVAYADILRYKIGNEDERAARRERLIESLELSYFKRKDNDRCSIER
jgi:hypothetical protein